MNKANKILVSVIIPVYNEEKNIVKCIESLAKQTYSLTANNSLEVIVVNDSSTDNTFNVAKTLGSKLRINLRIINLTGHQERAISRNTGAKSASGKYLLFIDADMKPSKKVIAECLGKIENDPAGFKAIIIPEESIGEGFWSECRALEKKCYIGDDRIEAARFFDKSAFWEVGGWDKNMISGEDWDLTRRIREKYKVGRINSKIYHNEGRLTLFKTALKKYYYGTYALPYWRKNLNNPRDVISFVIRPTYLRRWKLLLSDPLHAVGMIFLKTVEFTAGVLGIIRAKIFKIELPTFKQLQ